MDVLEQEEKSHGARNTSRKAIQTVSPKEKTKQQAFEDIQRESVKVFLHVQSKWDRF
jgi:hypothetical protein